MRAVVLVGLLSLSSTAYAERAMCGRNAKYHGARIDLDVKDADIHDVMRLLADVGHVNIVVADSVRGNVTLRLKRVPWDQVACTIAAVHKLTMSVDGNVVMVTK